MRRDRLIAIAAGLVLVVVFAAPASAGGGKAWAQPPRGSDQGWVFDGEGSSCGDASVSPYTTWLCLGFAVAFQPISGGRVTFHLPAGFVLDEDGAWWIDGSCSTDAPIVSGSTVTVPSVSCPSYGDSFWIGIPAQIYTSSGTYLIDGDYKTGDAKRSGANVYRWANDEELEVEPY